MMNLAAAALATVLCTSPDSAVSIADPDSVASSVEADAPAPSARCVKVIPVGNPGETALSAHTDTTIAVKSGARLRVNNFGGQIVVRVWGKNAVRIEADHSERARIEIQSSRQGIDVDARSRYGIPARVDYQITTPVWMALGLSGVYTDVSVEGSKGEVLAETVKGEVNVRGGEGLIKLSSVMGTINVGGARGRVEVSSINEAVNVRDVVGEVTVDAVNGSVMLERVDSPLVEAASVNGDITFLGTIRDHGRYHFETHNGSILVGVPQTASAKFSISTVNGTFDPSFTVGPIEKKWGKSFDFTLGSGSALIEVETFQGMIRLRRLLKGRLEEE
jgi:hypothetical protein